MEKMTTKVFIDGKAGTTGLRIYERLQIRTDIELLTLSEEDRKNPERRREMLNACNIAFLCLPDDASREAVAMIDNPDVVVLDTSTAHRTEPDWAYGFPELSAEHLENYLKAKAIVAPLLEGYPIIDAVSSYEYYSSYSGAASYLRAIKIGGTDYGGT